jgi:hypothetical protein
MIRKLILWLTLVIPGLVAVVIFAYFSLQDWSALQSSYLRYREVAAAHPSMQALYTAHAEQNIHRLNLFAEGVWTLLSAIIAAIGIHGLCVMKPGDRNA